MLTNKLWLVFMRMKQNFFIFLKKKIASWKSVKGIFRYQGWDEILMIILVSSQKSPTPNISAVSVHNLFFLWWKLYNLADFNYLKAHFALSVPTKELIITHWSINRMDSIINHFFKGRKLCSCRWVIPVMQLHSTVRVLLIIVMADQDFLRQ